MKVLIAALADHANIAHPGDKLNLMGVFDVIGAPQFPVVHPGAVLAIRLELEYEDGERKHTLAVVIVNQDGKEFAKIETQMEVAKVKPGQRLTANHLLFFRHLAFRAPESFSVLIRWDGELKQTLPLDVVAVPPPTATT
ncbi:MAG TPA: hypothetical protein VGA78_15820 [Gemmatimonadales bacterium]